MGKEGAMRDALGVTLLVLLLAATSAPVAGQTLVFEDNFELGNISQWSSSTVVPLQGCNCYFSGDCKASEFCYWGPGGPSNEDICEFRLPKPGGVLGAGCTNKAPGPGPVCDGVCSRLEDFPGNPWAPELVSRAVELWSEAMLRPSAAGGGPLDPELAAAALALTPEEPAASLELGRHAADLLMLTSHKGFYDHFCHFEHGSQGPDWYVDLGGDICRLESGRLAVEALQAELRGADGSPYLRMVPSYCPSSSMPTQPPCSYGSGPPLETFSCTDQRIRDLARLLGGRSEP